MPLLNIVPFIHSVLRAHVRCGDTVVDATMGNGHDTQLLARLVGPQGRVYAFDVQQRALDGTRERLGQEDLLARATLLAESHEHIAARVPGPASAILFNLGYLPGADKSVATQAETTLSALEQALRLLSPGGLLLVAIYWGHAAGAREKALLDPWFTRLDPAQYRVAKYEFLNNIKPAPYLILVERRGEAGWDGPDPGR